MCPDCNHINHDPGQCVKCNCGEAELIYRNPTAGYFEAHDSQGQGIYHDGLRAFPVRGPAIGEYAFE